MPRFTIKDLLITTTIVAIGGGMIGYATTDFTDGTGIRPDGQSVLFMFVGIGLMGAGFGNPFRRRFAGCMVAVLLWFLLGAVAAIYYN